MPGKKLQLKCPKAPVDSAPSAPLVVDIQQPRSISVSVDPEIVAHGSYPQKVAPLQHGPNLKQATPGSGAAAPKPGDDSVDGNLDFHKAVGSGGSQTTSIQPTVQHGVRGNTAGRVQTLPPPPAISAGSASAPPSFHNQPTSFSQYPRSGERNVRENSTVCFAVAGLSTCAKILIMAFVLLQILERTSESSGQLAEATHVQPLSRSSKRPTSVGGASNASTKSTYMDVPPTLDLRALSLNRATRASKAPSRLLLYHTTESRPPSPPPPPPVPPVKYEDSEMEDLYAPTREPQRRRSLSPQLPPESEPRVLPALAAKDPHVLAVLERQELREAARPRQGRRKSQPVQGAGKRRAGFVLVEGLVAGRADQKSRWDISHK